LKNLKSGKYEGIFNYPMKNFEKVLDKEEVEVEKEDESEVRDKDIFILICIE